MSSDPNSIDLTNPMPTNPAFFLDPLGNKFIYSLAQSIDIFPIWAVLLLGLGFAAASSNRKPTVGTGIATVVVVYGILALVSAGLKAAFS